MKNITVFIVLSVFVLFVLSCKKNELYKYPKDFPQWVKDVIDDPNNNPILDTNDHTLIQVSEFKNYSNGNYYYYFKKKIEFFYILEHQYVVNYMFYSESGLLICSQLDTLSESAISKPIFPTQFIDFNSYALRRSIYPYCYARL
jgi:hypothetical protein